MMLQEKPCGLLPSDLTDHQQTPGGPELPCNSHTVSLPGVQVWPCPEQELLDLWVDPRLPSSLCLRGTQKEHSPDIFYFHNLSEP